MASTPPLREVLPDRAVPLRPLRRIRDVSVIEGLGREERGGRQLHRSLAELNLRRLSPGHPTDAWESEVWRDAAAAVLEGRFLEQCRHATEEVARSVPKDREGFFAWLEGLGDLFLVEYGSFYEWIAVGAPEHSYRWLLRQEASTESQLDDIVALVQLGLSPSIKNALLRHLGSAEFRQRTLASELALGMEVEPAPLDCVCSEALASRNLLIGLAANRRYAHHALGALACSELLAAHRISALVSGSRRFGDAGAEGEERRTVSRALPSFHRAVLEPLLLEDPSVVTRLAEGALMAFSARLRTVSRFRDELGFTRRV